MKKLSNGIDNNHALVSDSSPPQDDGSPALPFDPNWASMLRQQPQALLAQAERWVADARNQGELSAIVSSYGIYSQALAACGDLEHALEVAQQAQKRAIHDGSPEYFNALFFVADILRRQGRREDCLNNLQAALASARIEGHFGCQPWLPDMMRHLCAEALEAGIEVDHVKEIIRQHQLLPGGPDDLHWPWPIRIYTLGRFALVHDGQPLSFTGKSPRKALELLQALIALGGREVHTAILTRNVWHDESSTDLRNLFDNTLHRLRRILGHEDTLLLSDGKLTLDSRHCWVDAWAFERLCGGSGQSAPAGKSAPSADKRVEAAFKLYQGHFLEREDETPWSVAYRDRLRSRFQRLVRHLGERLETAGEWLAAAEVYERGIEVDNLAESFYQRLMICHQQRGEHAEAVRVYRRCKELLSIVLGVTPSAATEAIRNASGAKPA